jgi:small subunit ribosomal protein S21
MEQTFNKGERMVGIIIKEGESIEAALRRFKRDCANAGILSEIKKREHYEKPSLVRKKAIDTAKRKRDKKKRIFAKKEKA